MPAERTVIDGPAGALEALFEDPREGVSAGVVVVCHPHPLHGGTLDNKVTHTLSRAFMGCGFASLRFNFRGVGKSEGRFADGDGEVDDVLTAVETARARRPGEPLWLAGFSFGAAMAVHAAAAAEPAGLVTVAPAATRFAGGLPVQPRCPWLVVHGDTDEVVPVDESVEWLDSLDPGPELVVFPGTGHFFHGELIALRETVARFVTRFGAPEAH